MGNTQNNAFGNGNRFAYEFPAHDARSNEGTDFLLYHCSKGKKKALFLYNLCQDGGKSLFHFLQNLIKSRIPNAACMGMNNILLRLV